MSIQKFLQSAFKSSLPVMGSEEITLEGRKIQAVEDETTSSETLALAGDDKRRTLIVKFPASLFPGPIKSGMAVFARDEKWQISCEDDSIRRGKIAITLVLVEPERGRE